MREENPRIQPSLPAPASPKPSPNISQVKTTHTGPWAPFVHTSGTYDLDHLKNQTIRYEQPAQDGKPARIYNVEVEFSSHCFTRSARDGEIVDQYLVYPGEKRIFDFDRYQLSKMLPEIMAQLPWRSCYQTGNGNFFTIEIQESGSYEVYFKVEKVGKGRLKLFVQSAYLRDPAHGSHSRGHKIRFFVVLFNTLTNKPIKITPLK